MRGDTATAAVAVVAPSGSSSGVVTSESARSLFGEALLGGGVLGLSGGCH